MINKLLYIWKCHNSSSWHWRKEKKSSANSKGERNGKRNSPPSCLLSLCQGLLSFQIEKHLFIYFLDSASWSTTNGRSARRETALGLQLRQSTAISYPRGQTYTPRTHKYYHNSKHQWSLDMMAGGQQPQTMMSDTVEENYNEELAGKPLKPWDMQVTPVFPIL